MQDFQVRLVALLAFGFEETLRRLLISSTSPAPLTCFNPCNYNKINPNTRSLIEALEGVNHVNELLKSQNCLDQMPLSSGVKCGWTGDHLSGALILDLFT